MRKLLILIIAFWGIQCSEKLQPDTTEIFTELGFYSIDNTLIPTHAPEYPGCEIEYPYIVERGLPMNSVFKMRSLPDGFFKMEIIAPEYIECNFFHIRVCSYLKNNNHMLWNRYFAKKNFPEWEFDVVSVYHWKLPTNYTLWLIAYNFEGDERVIYGFVENHYLNTEQN